jgi:TPP-dependent pyruvate/acetoin dehydrogenase alpha subunit
MSSNQTLDRDQALRAFHAMLRIRMVEEAIAERYAEQEMRCPVHLSIGQEAAAVGVCQPLRHTDKAFSTHRCHSHYLAKGGALRPMLAEIYGKVDGCLGGRGGSMHLTSPEHGMMMSVPIVGSSIALAVGDALATALDGGDAVSIAFFGDAAIEEGIWHESANFAQLRKLPVIFACENNLYSVYTPLRERQPNRPLTHLAEAHGMAAVQADGNDVEAVVALTSEAVERARRGDGPTFLQFDTYRWREHCGPNYDNHLGYRTAEEFERWRADDPLERYAAVLTKRGVLEPAGRKQMADALTAEIDEAFAFAKASPLPDPSTVASHVYA